MNLLKSFLSHTTAQFNRSARTVSAVLSVKKHCEKYAIHDYYCDAERN